MRTQLGDFVCRKTPAFPSKNSKLKMKHLLAAGLPLSLAALRTFTLIHFDSSLSHFLKFKGAASPQPPQALVGRNESAPEAALGAGQRTLCLCL